MSQSDDVVVASDTLGFASAISPSGEDVGTYFDVKVLRSFKGHSKIGDVLTFGVPRGDVYCEPPPVRSGPFVGAQTLNFDWLEAMASRDSFRCWMEISGRIVREVKLV